MNISSSDVTRIFQANCNLQPDVNKEELMEFLLSSEENRKKALEVLYSVFAPKFIHSNQRNYLRVSLQCAAYLDSVSIEIRNQAGLVKSKNHKNSYLLAS